jgi:hypothetical protein
MKTRHLTSEDDPTLLGLVPGTAAEGEPGAARTIQSIAWALPYDETEGAFSAVYVIQDGTILDQTGPSMLEPVMQQLAIYDRPHGHYVVEGCRVTGLGANAGGQEFSIEQGEANISGFKRTRHAAIRLSEQEIWDEGAVPGETHTYPGGASYTFKVNQPPISMINSILITKEKTVMVTRGSIANGVDGLPDSSVTQIMNIPGYTQGVDYQRMGDAVDWGLPGNEPTVGTSYECTYRYRTIIQANSYTHDEITVSGGATGGDVIVAYTTRLPRIDRIGLREDGSAVYIKGVSARANPVPPIVPSDVLQLATVSNNWIERPVVENDAIRSVPYGEIWRYFNRIIDMDRLVQQERLKNDIDSREPVAKKGMFVDAFENDTMRDAGIEQSAAVGNGIFQLAIVPTVHRVQMFNPVTLDFTEEVIAVQDLKTACTKINPYANFTQLPGTMDIDPAVDFWTVQQTEWLSPETINLNMGQTSNRRTPLRVTTEENKLIDQRSEQAEFLREIPVEFNISGFGAGEILDLLTFDAISVLPAGGLTADVDGRIQGTFTIPANVTAGTKTISAEGRGGSQANAFFTGMGTINIDVMRRVTTIRTWTFVDADPQAQMFAVPEPRQMIGVDFHLCQIGDQNKGLLIEQVTIDNGYPTTEVMAQSTVSMVGAVEGWKHARYRLPVTTQSDRKFAFVIKTDDNEHSVSLAKLGEFDQDQQKFVSSHPYVIGPRFSSVNAETWSAHQDEALTFRLIAAKYTSTTKTVDLGTIDLDQCSDLQIRAVVELPSPACSVVFEVERTNGTIYKLLPYQLLELTEYITETVKLRAILTGTSKLSPILFAPIELISGTIKTEATYVSRAMALGTNVRVSAYLKTFIPGGATFKMEYSIEGGAFVSLPVAEVEQLAFPMWSEQKFQASNLSGQNIRLKIIATGGPSSRIAAGDFGAGIF